MQRAAARAARGCAAGSSRAPRGCSSSRSACADERAQAPLRHAFGARIDRRQRLLERRRAASLTRRYSGCTISRPSGPRRTSPKQRRRVPRARRLLLREREIEEAQREEARAVGDAAQQLPAPAVGDLGELHLAFDRGAHAGRERAERRDAGCGPRSAAAAGTAGPAPACTPRRARRSASAAPTPRSAVTGRCSVRAAALARRCSAKMQDALDFDPRAARQLRDADGGARRIGLA